METEQSANRWTYAGLFLVTLTTLMYEILLTRIFSVTMWYHFAFVAISVAMFGITLGALRVYLSPTYFTEDKTHYHMAFAALLFSISIVASFLVHANVPFFFNGSFSSFASVAITYSVFLIPFVFSGICVCLALTRFPRSISRLYAADLTGAALGCVLLIYVLNITDGPTAVVVVAFTAALGSLLFSMQKKLARTKVKVIASAACLGFLAFSLFNTFLVWHQKGLIHLGWAKDLRDPPHLYEKWNTFSRITVDGDPDMPTRPFGWGLSPLSPTEPEVRQLYLQIDYSAGTVLTHFTGDFSQLSYLKYDITNIVHYIRPNSRVLIVGTGGGRDILSALEFHQKQVVGVEMNRAILNAANGIFGDFTGHLDRYPQVKFVNDEARSYITRQREKFDIIQISLVDTWAATAAGALVLTENSLYTEQAWKIFLDRLTPRGILSVSRWYVRSTPNQIYRLTSLANAALRKIGIQDPRSHIVILGVMPDDKPRGVKEGMATMLVSRETFSNEDLDRIEDIARRLKFQVVLSPRYALDSTFGLLASSNGLPPSLADLPINMAPPTDNQPFFFYCVRLRDVLKPRLWRTLEGEASGNRSTVLLLGGLLAFVTVLTLLCIILPLGARRLIRKQSGPWPMLTFFAAIGFGFMLVEISQMERLMIFLGHPVYAMSVVLFALLLSSGLGSYGTRNIDGADLRGKGLRRLSGLLIALVLFGFITTPLMEGFASSTTSARILIAVCILFPLGFMMGVPFPVGLKQASLNSPDMTPWLWGINGATSVCASVLAIAIALSFGISASFWSGFGCYVLAFGAFLWACHKSHLESDQASPGQSRADVPLITS